MYNFVKKLKLGDLAIKTHIKNTIKKGLYSDNFVVIVGLIVVPLLSFAFLSMSPESPLYTSISRIAWVHNLWFATFVWAVVVMSAIAWLTYRMAHTGMLETKKRRIFLIWQFISIILVFTGCLLFPAKNGTENIVFVNYIHDYLTAIAWMMYVMGLVSYSFAARKQNKVLGLISLGLMGYIIFSSLFFLIRVIDPQSYVGASAVSEVYIINNLLIYLVVMFMAQKQLCDNNCKSNK